MIDIPPGLIPWVEGLQWFFFGYFICINLAYLALNYISLFGIARYMRDHDAQYLPRSLAAYLPPVSILIPARNEEKEIGTCVRSLLQLDYPQFEIVVINDGSTDDTLATLIDQFALVEVPEAYRNRLHTEPVKAVYASLVHPNVRLVDKARGGKADGLNAGINCARYPLFCVVDADCILQPDSIARVVQPFLEDASTVACGGVVHIVNGCTVKDGFLTEVNLPKNFLVLCQVVEYLRAFLFGRVGWASHNALLIISGAFGMFRKERAIAAGGYVAHTMGEDMELVMRLHRTMRKEKRPYRIAFVPDPICWTEAPRHLGALQKQRMRWQQGLAESLTSNMGIYRGGGVISWLAVPFMWLFEFFGPLIEVVGYVMMILFWIFGLLSWPIFLIFLFASVGIGVLLSVNALLLEEISFHLYPRPAQQLKLFLVAILENLGYRQLTAVWRLMGLVKWIFARSKRRQGNEERRHNASWQDPPPRPDRRRSRNVPAVQQPSRVESTP